jgi:C-terminal processing protease CtpA/Prc
MDSSVLFSEILADLDAAYVDPVQPDKLFETGVRAMLGSLDPYTEYENNKDSQNLDILTYGRYGGVGLTIASDSKYEVGKGEVKDSSRVLVVDALEGYAFDAGVRTGDHIVSVADQSVAGKELSEITQLLRGEPGSSVKVEFERDGIEGRQQVVLQRKSVRIKDVPVTMFLGDKSEGIGYVLLRGFAVDTGRYDDCCRLESISQSGSCAGLKGTADV